jgi:hypothetical protein
MLRPTSITKLVSGSNSCNNAVLARAWTLMLSNSRLLVAFCAGIASLLNGGLPENQDFRPKKMRYRKSKSGNGRNRFW